MTTHTATIEEPRTIGTAGIEGRVGPARLLIGVGLAVTLATTAALAFRSQPTGEGSHQAPVAASPVAAPPLVATVSASDVTVVRMAYEPGQTSGWHTHPGIHAVAVLSGSLTVYGRDCAPETYGPGESYVGGQELHVTRNETAVPVELVVTSVDTAVAANSVTAHDAPAGCDVR